MFQGLKTLFGTGWRYAHGKRFHAVVHWSGTALSVAVILAGPLVINRIVRTVESGGLSSESLTTVYGYLGLYAALEVAFWLLHGPARVIEQRLASTIASRFLQDQFSKVLHQSLGWHQGQHSGKTIERISKARSSLENFWSNSFLLIRMCLRLVGAVVLLCYFFPIAGVAIVLLSGLILLSVYLFDKGILHHERSRIEKEQHYSETVQDGIGNVRSLKSIRIEQLTQSELSGRLQALEEPVRQYTWRCEAKWFTTSIFVRLSVTALLGIFMALGARRGQALRPSELVLLFQYLLEVGEQFFELTYMLGYIGRQATNVQAVQDLLDLPTPNHETKERVFPEEWETICIGNLSFQYEGKAKSGMENANLTLRRGNMVALIGPSGSGKSTLLTLMRGLLTAKSGGVVVDGRIMGGLDLLHEVTSLIPQDPELFKGTIRYNLTLGQDATEEEIATCLALSQSVEVVADLPDGLDTDIAEKGVSLSGGQKQRLALARGLFFALKHNSEVICLDEPTSSVDSVNDRRIYEQIRQAFSEKLVISSIHRLSLLELFDEIYFFDGGKVVEHGTLDELLERKGKFFTFYKLARMEEQENEVFGRVAMG